MSATVISAMMATEFRHNRPKNNGQIVKGLSRKPINLGIASADPAGLKELVGVLQVTMRACPFRDLAIPFGRNGSKVFKWLTSGSKDPTAEVIE